MFFTDFNQPWLEFDRLYPNIGETTTKIEDYGKEKTLSEFFSLAK